MIFLFRIVVDTLSLRVQVALVIYNEGVLTNVIDGCYATYLSLATPANVNLFQKFLKTLPTPRGTFILSFPCKKIIIRLSDRSCTVVIVVPLFSST